MTDEQLLEEYNTARDAVISAMEATK